MMMIHDWLMSPQENYLRHLGLVPSDRPFTLNDITNTFWCEYDSEEFFWIQTLFDNVPVDAALYIDFDKYDLFAITVSLECCKALKEQLVKEFEFRQNIVDAGGEVLQRMYHVRRPSSYATLVLKES